VPADGIELSPSSGPRNRLPDTLELAVRGISTKRVAASWNGMPWVM